MFSTLGKQIETDTWNHSESDEEITECLEILLVDIDPSWGPILFVLKIFSPVARFKKECKVEVET